MIQKFLNNDVSNDFTQIYAVLSFPVRFNNLFSFEVSWSEVRTQKNLKTICDFQSSLNLEVPFDIEKLEEKW